MNMTEQHIEIIGVIVSVSALLGWLMKRVVAYFIKNSNDKLLYIEQLVKENQDNTEKFVNAINHQQTMNREVQIQTVEALNSLKDEISKSNAINEKLISFIKKV